MSAPSSREVLILQHEASGGPGVMAEVLEAAGLSARVCSAPAGDPLPAGLREAQRPAGLLVLGGAMGVADVPRLPWLRRELELIGEAVREEIPVLGICLGSQLLAAALGAPVLAGSVPHVGWLPVRLQAEAAKDPLLGGLASPLRLFQWHADGYSTPPGAVSLATSDTTACEAFRFGATAYGLQFHLEVTADTLGALIDGFPEELQASGVAPAALQAATAEHLPRSLEVARQVFGRWTTLLG